MKKPKQSLKIQAPTHAVDYATYCIAYKAVREETETKFNRMWTALIILAMIIGYLITLLSMILMPPTASAAAEEPAAPYTVEMQIYHYALDPRCTGKWTKYNKTASGTTPTVGRTIAHGSLPFGTPVMIDGDIYIVEDRGVRGNKLDVFVSDYDTAIQMGTYKKTVTVFPVTDPDPSDSWRTITSKIVALVMGWEVEEE